jgi:small subunit ribosomal protein S1
MTEKEKDALNEDVKTEQGVEENKEMTNESSPVAGIDENKEMTVKSSPEMEEETNDVAEPETKDEAADEKIADVTDESLPDQPEVNVDAAAVEEAATETEQEEAAAAALAKDEEVNMVDVTAAEVSGTPEPAEAKEEVAEAKEEPVEKTKEPVVQSDDTTGNVDFDWDIYEADVLEETSENQKKLEEMYSDTLSTIAENEVIDGTVISMNKREVVINIGFKSEGVVSVNEFRYNPELKIGDTVEVYVENQEDKKGQLILSHKKARAMRSWDRVNQALEQDEVIKGYIKCRTKGGMIVDVFGIEAFLPGSQIDVKPIQ